MVKYKLVQKKENQKQVTNLKDSEKSKGKQKTLLNSQLAFPNEDIKGNSACWRYDASSLSSKF